MTGAEPAFDRLVVAFGHSVRGRCADPQLEAESVSLPVAETG